MLGELLPDNIKIIAACNPYRLKKEDVEPTVGLVFQYQQDENPIPDPLEKLVYRVLPLPDTMLEYVFDYGALPAGTETVFPPPMNGPIRGWAFVYWFPGRVIPVERRNSKHISCSAVHGEHFEEGAVLQEWSVLQEGTH